MHLPQEIIWNANLMQQGNFINEYLARNVSGTYAHHQEYQMLSCSIWFSAPYTRPTKRLSSSPPIQKFGAVNHMLQHNIQCYWWWTYVPETCQAKNTPIKLPSGTICTVHTTHAAALKTTTHPKLGVEPICCNTTSNATDDGRVYPKHVELRIHQ